MNLRFNSDTTSNYSDHVLWANGSSWTNFGDTSQTKINVYGALIAQVSAVNEFGLGILDIVDYTSTSKYKTTKSLHGGHGYGVVFDSGSWRSLSAISQIDLQPTVSGSFISGSRFSLYGIKG